MGDKIALGRFDLSTIPLGLGYIAAVLESNGFLSTILDMSVTNMQTEKLDDRLNEIKPDIVGISTMTSNYLNATRVAKTVKRWNPECVVVMGGVHATFMHRNILETVPEVDVVVRYEGEFAMSELARVLDENDSPRAVRGISFRENGRLVSTPPRGCIEDLDKLPYPAHHLLEPPVEEYLGQYLPRSLPVMTSRGCPFSCIYCSTMALHGQRYRTRSIANVMGELEYLVEKFEVTDISFVDDNFTMQKDRVIELCREIKKRNLSIEWGCSARVDQVSDGLLRAMKDAGCRDIFFGIESASQHVLDLVRKGFRVEQAKEAVRTAEKLNIRTHCSFILGLPGESVRSLKNMVAFVEETKPTGRALPNRLSILPGTELFEKKEEYFSSQPTAPDADLTKTQIEIFTTFFRYRFAISELFRVVPPNLEIE